MQYRQTDHSATAGNGASSDVRDGELLTPGEVARLFGVDPKTVTRWAGAGKLTALRTLGGHRRYRSTEVFSLLERTDPGRSGRPRAEGVANWGV
jgi:excisionase family DNA binding protein